MTLTVTNAGFIVGHLIEAIQANRAYLSEIDGLIGDGDHGINMAKGFGQCRDALGDPLPALDICLDTLGATLLNGIGGSMGPLYGSFFMAMGEAIENVETLDAPAIAKMLRAGYESVSEIGEAQLGDKTLLDCLHPAVVALETNAAEGRSLPDCLTAMSAAAEQGREATRDMVAKVGRASRLGERSRGVLDAGATSCCIILQTLATDLASG